MVRGEKITAIYENMGNKDRTFWCIYIVKDEKWRMDDVRETEWECMDLTYWDEYLVEYWNDMTETNYLVSIIWHPVMIWDVLDFFKDKRFYCTKCKKIVDWRDVSDNNCWWEYYCDICNNDSLLDIEDDILFYWYKKREPIEAQQDECIDYIYNLIGK